MSVTLVEELVEREPEQARTAGGLDSPQLAALYEEHSRAIYYLALRMLGDPTQAEDATHDVFVRAYRHLSDFKGLSNIRTWLYRIAINHCRNLSNTWAHRHIRSGVDDAVWATLPDRGDDPLRVIEIKELGARIQKALEALSDEYRLLLLLVADAELSYEEVGELTSQSADAVRGKLHRARKAFAIQFNQTA